MKSQKSLPTVTGDIGEIAATNGVATSSIVLILTGLLTIWGGYWAANMVAPTLALMILAYLLAVLAVVDIRHGILPHMLTGTLFVVGGAVAPSLGHTYWEAILGGVVGFAGLALCAAITFIVTRKEAVGGGDLWLVLGLGAWMGVAALPFFLVMTAVTGAISIFLKNWLTQGYPVITEQEAQKFAFGPALCAAGWMAVLYGDWYWKVMDLLIGTAG